MKRKSVDTELDSNGILELLAPGFHPVPTGPGAVTEVLIRTPMRLKRRGLGARLIIAEASDQTAHSSSTEAIRKALRNAHRWNEALLSGEVRTLTCLSQIEGVHPRYLSKLIRLANLAPDLQQALLKGAVPADLTLDRLLAEMPAAWADQRSRLGIPA